MPTKAKELLEGATNAPDLCISPTKITHDDSVHYFGGVSPDSMNTGISISKCQLQVNSNDMASPATTPKIQGKVTPTVTQKLKRTSLSPDEESVGCIESTVESPDEFPDDPLNTLSLDPYISIETGANLTFTLASITGSLEAGFLSGTEDLSSAVGVPLRLARAVFLDHPVANWLAVLQHEAFGHGGRARELGASASFHMASPWTCDVLFEGSTRFGAGASFDPDGLDSDDQQVIFTGGVESNGFAATLIEREMVAGRPMRPVELLFLVRNRLYPSYYVYANTPDPANNPDRFFREWSEGGDVARYLGFLNERFHGEAGIERDEIASSVVDEFRRLERQAIWNALDPGMWLALWRLGDWVVTGRESQSVPLPHVGDYDFLPLLSSDWLPDGGTVSLETVFSHREPVSSRPRWFSFTVRRGDGPGGSWWAFGGANEQVLEIRGLHVGGEFEVWQPPSTGWGGGLRIRLEKPENGPEGIFVDIGAKTDGHWPGRPLGPGLFVSCGARF